MNSCPVYDQVSELHPEAAQTLTKTKQVLDLSLLRRKLLPWHTDREGFIWNHTVKTTPQRTRS